MSTLLTSGARTRARIVLIAGVSMLLAGAIATLPSMAWAAPAATPTVQQMTQRVIDDTNAVRAEKGLPALVRNADLDRVAADWARQQWQNGAMSHNPNYTTQIPAGWQRAGENVGKGYTYADRDPGRGARRRSDDDQPGAGRRGSERHDHRRPGVHRPRRV